LLGNLRISIKLLAMVVLAFAGTTEPTPNGGDGGFGRRVRFGGPATTTLGDRRSVMTLVI
jgi:hypothetical protein